MKNESEFSNQNEKQLKKVWQKPELESCLLEQTQGSPGSGADGVIPSS